MQTLPFPTLEIPIVQLSIEPKNIQLFMKREDLVHPEISGNKYWKLFYNIKNYVESNPKNPFIITFGGAYSNHISATSYLAQLLKIKSLGIIRGEELALGYGDNPTLSFAHQNGMDFHFVNRETYRNKEQLKTEFKQRYPDAIIIEEGGTNSDAVLGIRHMLNAQTKDFHYLCTAVGTGGTIAGISKFCEENQKVIGFKAVQDDLLEEKILHWSGKSNFSLIEATERYGKIDKTLVAFINWFYSEYQIPLDPVYTGKMMLKIFEMLKTGYFPENSKILAFHTGGLQGIAGANQFLQKKNLPLIKFNIK